MEKENKMLIEAKLIYHFILQPDTVHAQSI